MITLSYEYLRQQSINVLRDAALQLWPDKEAEIQKADHNQLCYSISLVTDEPKVRMNNEYRLYEFS